MSVINPKQEFVIVELERTRWFLGQLDLTADETAGLEIQQAYNSVLRVIECLKRSKRETG
jgi:hypothetical protein